MNTVATVKLLSVFQGIYTGRRHGADLASASGSLLCQDALGRVVVGFVVTGPGSGLSEVLVWGCEPATLD